MRIFSTILTAFIPLLLMCSCLEVEETVLTLKYSRSEGRGQFNQVFSNIHDSNSKAVKKNIPSEDKKGIEDLLNHLKTVLKSMGSKKVKGEVKSNSKNNSFNAYLSGEFFSFGHLPFFSSINISFEDEDETVGKTTFGRLDQIIEFNINSKDLVSTAKDNTFVFVSTDKDAQIVRTLPEGKISKDGKTVTWQINKKNKETVPYSVRLKGKSYKNL